MLTADLVDARKTKDGELLLRPMDEESRSEARVLAEAYLEAARSLVGRRREELDEAWETATGDSVKRFKVAAGLRKLISDECTFEAEVDVDPIELRRVLFTNAAEARRAQSEGTTFPRAHVIEAAAKTLNLEPSRVERAMFCDLKNEHVLREAPKLDVETLIESWELGQAQAVLLAAVRVTIDIGNASPGLARAFFAKLKFHKLLFRIDRRSSEKGWRVVIDGPYSMFDSVTKYGLKLAFLVPALRELEDWALVADVRWGKLREPLTFKMFHGDLGRVRGADDLHVADDVRELADAINAGDSGWRAKIASSVFDVPGQGVCIPDLELTRGKSTTIHVEVMGYWSRDAVFKRVELTEKGLTAPIIFAVSSRLRVSEEVLDESTSPSSLYVYKGKMSPRSLLARADLLAERARPTPARET